MLNIKVDSRLIKPGDTFIALNGAKVDGHDYILDAIKLGATKVIVSKPGDYGVETILVSDTEKYLKDYLAANYSEKINKLNLVGVTGTNGKTTTCFLVYQMLQKLGKNVAYIGTLGYFYKDIHQNLANTTPGILELYELLLNSVENGCDTVVMEVSSHSLDQGRIFGLKFDVVAFTNLTQDHLDYHKTMDKYLKAKLQILRYLKPQGVSITNLDDEHGKYFLTNNSKTISLNKADYQILNYEDTNKGMNINFLNENKEYICETNLKSKFNVYNFLTCLAIARALGNDIEDLLKVAKEITAPKGRCEQIKINDAMAVVDYAHTPDAVLKVITAFEENKKGKIITIVGCGGDRDTTKRAIMGKYATEHSDYVIFTNDNPRTEEPSKIMADILIGVENDNYDVIYNREEAIIKGLNLLKKDDILLVLGKGHEDYQIIGTEKHHFDDKEVIINYQKRKEK